MDRELFDAARDGNVGEVLRTLLLGADKNAKVGQLTPLHVACWNGHLDTVRALLLVKADVESRSMAGWTPLLCALKRVTRRLCNCYCKSVRISMPKTSSMRLL